MGPSNNSYLSNTAIFHFRDYGRKSKNTNNWWKEKKAVVSLSGCFLVWLFLKAKFQAMKQIK